MRNPERIKPILDRIEAVWKNNPDLRLGQILVSTLQHEKNVANSNVHLVLFNIGDENLVSYIENFLSKPE